MERISVPYNRKGDPDVHNIVIPSGYISLEDLLSHVGYQLGINNVLVDELNAQLAIEHMAGRREIAEELQNQTVYTANVSTDMEAAHRILTAELVGSDYGAGHVN